MADNALPVVVRTYYRAIDAEDYDALEAVLHPEFQQIRPDRRFDGADAFVRFMREDRPRTDTVHEIHHVFRDVEPADGRRVAVEGTLRSESADPLFAFVDVMDLTPDDRIRALQTYTC